ncbi:MAG: ABC transporter ATP-binding protein [Ruminococcus sp.]|uniref:ABC transporter ATP-binding protein n=1 Tax=Ruminococcus sp. TaxID=41978 RepID=UPI001B5B689C|nr:ABC transporter ATP-binding protein [Ruminococcus sp.]MBO4493242.1 ABC transporter ATP-binding protein [Ruminococcus sp.]MBP5433885.1 ABC transporter ATP-binding protein [Ruminococcus sp.]
MPPRTQRPMAKPENTLAALKRIFTYMHGFRLQFILVVIGIFISSGAGIAGNYLLKPIIDNIEDALKTGNWKYGKFIGIIIVMVVIYACGALSTLFYQRIMLKISTTTLMRIRNDLFCKMEMLPIRFFDKHTHGELMSLYTNDTDAIREMLSNSIAQFISSAITIVGVFTAMLIYSWRLTILVVAMLFVIFKVIGFVGSRSGKGFMAQQKALGSVNGYIEEMIDGQKVVKVFCHEEKADEEFDRLNEELCRASTHAHTFANILMPIMNNLSYIHYAATAIAGGIMTVKGIGGMTVGTVVSYLQFTRSFSMPITQVSQQLNSVLTALAGAERIFRIIDEEPEADEGYVTLVNAEISADGKISETDKRTGRWAWKHPHKSDGTVTYTEVRGNVEFDDVVFGYEPNKTVLNGISLYAKPGQKIAFVGSTGAGKTTIINLINRFYDVPEGKIRYDGININKIKKDDLRRSQSIVLQDTHLFTGTVMENIRYGKLDATDEEVYEAAKLANADSFIRHLENGYDTMLTADGSNLSQGQRQLLAIARAAVADPPVLILDEATSSIDTRTEALIEKGMDSLMEGRTVFVIAHRLSTVRNSHAIMVLEHGKIIERGNHNELIAQHGKYYQLYTGMFELS